MGGDDPLGEEMATHSQYFYLENPMVRGAWQATVHGVSKNWTQPSNNHSLTHLQWRVKYKLISQYQIHPGFGKTASLSGGESRDIRNDPLSELSWKASFFGLFSLSIEKDKMIKKIPTSIFKLCQKSRLKVLCLGKWG